MPFCPRRSAKRCLRVQCGGRSESAAVRMKERTNPTTRKDLFRIPLKAELLTSQDEVLLGHLPNGLATTRRLSAMWTAGILALWYEFMCGPSPAQPSGDCATHATGSLELSTCSRGLHRPRCRAASARPNQSTRWQGERLHLCKCRRHPVADFGAVETRGSSHP